MDKHRKGRILRPIDVFSAHIYGLCANLFNQVPDVSASPPVRLPFECSGINVLFRKEPLNLLLNFVAVRVLSSKKSVSAHQLHRMLKLTYKTAWFMAHRIRFAVSDDGATKLNGVVEVDETFIGGKGDPRHRLSQKIPVVALIEQGGKY